MNHSPLPAVVAAVAFASVSVFGKASFGAGADVSTFLAFRGVLGVAVMALWLRHVPRAVSFPPRGKTVALGLGLLFAANVYTLFKAIELIPVPIVELTYFIYPLLTGVFAAVLGLDRLSARGAVAAVVAFGGLALMVGAHAEGLAPLGLALAALSAGFRAAMLLATRAWLPAADPRITSWYTMFASTAVFVAACVATSTWNLPSGAAGWAAFLWASVAASIAVLAMFVSAARIGPFRTALIMNVEPLAAIVLSYAVLGEAINATQWVGAAIMLGALVWFQLRR